MLGEPKAAHLIEAVASYLEKDALPVLSGRAAFHGRVAVNALRIVARELELGPTAAERERASLVDLLGEDGELAALRAKLCARIREGVLNANSPGLLDHLARATADRVAIEQPNYGSLRLVRG